MIWFLISYLLESFRLLRNLFFPTTATISTYDSFRLADLPKEIIFQIFENGPLLVGVSFNAPPLLLAVARHPTLYSIALKMYKRENRTFCVNRNVYPQAMQDIRKLSFPELDKIRCIRFVWTYFDSVGLTDKPFQNLVRGKKITMRNNLIKVVFVFAFNYPEPRYYIDTHNSQPQVDGMNRFEYPTIIQANIEFLSRASKEGIKTVESGIEGVNTLFEDRRREDILVWISCPPVAPTDRRFLKLPFMEDNVEVGRNSGLLLTWYTKKKSSIHDKERFVNGLRPRLIPGEDRPS